MSQAGTQYSEKERRITLATIDKFNLNPHAFDLMIRSYMQHCAPQPVKFFWKSAGKDIMDTRGPTVGEVELYIHNAGYFGSRWADMSKFDVLAAKMFCMSYYQNLRPLPVSFQVFDAIEIHLRTPSMSDFDKDFKNPFREIMPHIKDDSKKKDD